MQSYADMEHVWNKLQEPARRGQKPADHLLLLSALDEGWKIVETVRFEPFTLTRVGAYLLTLFHPQRLLSNQMIVGRSEEIDNLLQEEDAIVVNRHTQ